MNPLEVKRANIVTGKNKAGLPLSPLILGTAQLGMPYGIANQDGKPDYQALLSIIKSCMEQDILAFDTANGYGDSEARLGEAFTELGIADRVQVMTKIGVDALDSESGSFEIITQTLARLKISKLSVLYSHCYKVLESPSATRNFKWLKKQNFADNFGLSVYSAKEALAALELDHVDFVQMPLNALDHQATQYCVIDRAKSLGKTICFRSVFLQGLLLLKPDQIPESMQFSADILSKWRQLCGTHGMTPYVAALRLANYLAAGMPLVIGCETSSQVKDNIKALNNTDGDISALVADTVKLAASVPEKMRNPTLWPK
jgi:aryl-alcohol dehydrogenase-like predicted oxidoreductase